MEKSETRKPFVALQQTFWLLVLVSWMSPLNIVSGQEEAEEEESPYRSGLVAEYSAGGPNAQGQLSCQRVDELIAFDWQNGAPDSRLPSGLFKATWNGRLLTLAAGEYRLHVFVNGKVEVMLDGRKIISGETAEPQWVSSDPIDLTFDYRPLAITFEKSGDAAQLALYWSGPGFPLEPISPRFLFHERKETPDSSFLRGSTLAAALRCTACHQEGEQSAPLSAPALDRLAGNLDRQWLVDWLSAKHSAPPSPAKPASIERRMPHFGLSAEDSEAIAVWLLQSRFASTDIPAAYADSTPAKEKKSSKANKGKSKGSPAPSATEGERLFVTLGCLACHRLGELGESGLFGGGDLTQIAAKRPRDLYFASWLANPAALNKHHRMPVFDLSADQRLSLDLYLRKQGKPAAARRDESDGKALLDRGRQLVETHRCAACHALPGEKPGDKAMTAKLPATLSSKRNWASSCAANQDAEKGQPKYRLAESDQAALQQFFTTARPGRLHRSAQDAGLHVLIQQSCLACHQREGINRASTALPPSLQEKLPAVADRHDELAKLVPAMTPPALNSAGDKLTDAALADSILRRGPAHRPYMMVQMPKFNLSDSQLKALTAWFTATDRIPAGLTTEGASEPSEPQPSLAALTAAGPRLVTTDGFGCTSCHQIGSVAAEKAPLNARGPSLSRPEKRIRRDWFNRWCASPARIVPRMEMPSVQVPVRGVLGEKIDHQLAAVWHTLNVPGFEPPEPNPVRVLRQSGDPARKEQAIVIHDVVKDGEKTFLFPLVIGLSNRQNVLFDLQTNRLALWWLGDTARQRTKGKTWHWEPGGPSIINSGMSGSEISLILDGKEYLPIAGDGQFIATFDSYNRVGTHGVLLTYRLSFDLPSPDSGKPQPTQVRLVQGLRSLPEAGSAETATGFARDLFIDGVPAKAEIRVRLADAAVNSEASYDNAKRTLKLKGGGNQRISISQPAGFRWLGDGSFTFRSPAAAGRDITNALPADQVTLEYLTDLPVDQYLADPPPVVAVDPTTVEIAPGLTARRLPLPDDIMPSALAWTLDGRLLFTTLKGQAYVAEDADSDGLEDSLRLLADGLATPYGICADGEKIDVLAKQGLLRLDLKNPANQADRVTTIASGWGVTDDYHDWAIGLVKSEKGEYLLGLPCQQDGRGEAAARHRGQMLRLVPRQPTPDNPRLFSIRTVSAGHRFPMGLATNREGDLFVTDNQGNYNPFNELNHVRQGAHFGFINAIEKDKADRPPLAPPAIDIPHPWTRSVNGICFLDTPAGANKKQVFGMLEGHLIGCEYDTRRLIRMTLDKVGNTYQGAAYPLSMPASSIDAGLLGPIVCAVSPRGELYVGEIRDSGWGAGNNIGQIVKIKIDTDQLPCGIAEMRATPDGFTIDFFQSVDPAKAADLSNYTLVSYRRESTPAYGGPNLDRRTEKIAKIEVRPDASRVTLHLDELREGFVYELQLKKLSRGNDLFHPAEAHYTLRQTPSKVPR